MFWVRSDLESRKKVSFQFGGVFWVRSDLESRKKVRVFQFSGGGCSGTKSQNTWVFWGIWSEISGS